MDKLINLQNIFNESTSNGKVVGLAAVLLEQCTAEQSCPCVALLSMSREKIEAGYPEYWKDEDNNEYQDIDKTWDYVWNGEDCEDGDCKTFPLDKLHFLDDDLTNTIPVASTTLEEVSPLKTVVEKALARTDWKKSEVWQLCSLYDLLKRSSGVLTKGADELSKCTGCATTIETWATDLCNKACDIFYEGYVEVVDDEVSEGGFYKFIDFDNRYTTTVPMQFFDAVLQQLGMSSHDGTKLSNCIDKLTISYDDYSEVDRFGRNKAAGVGVYEAFKLQMLPKCIPMASPYRTRNLRFDELDHPISARYRGETKNSQTTTRTTWNCGEDGQCYDPQNGKGTYTSLEACQSNCLNEKSSKSTKTKVIKKKSNSTADWY
tara:strand:+ start:5234 stop:6358 length:1125 start_codon:yes stop_codon:yes gene_type:complete